MRARVLALACSLVSLAPSLFAQGGTVPQYATITAGEGGIQDGAGNTVLSGTITFTPYADAHGTPIAPNLTGGGRLIPRPVVFKIVGGAVSAAYGATRLVDVTQANPANFCYADSIHDNVSGQTWTPDPCIQPAWNASWCTYTVSVGIGSTTCDLSKFVPTGTPGALLTAGPGGPGFIFGLTSDLLTPGGIIVAGHIASTDLDTGTVNTGEVEASQFVSCAAPPCSAPVTTMSPSGIYAPALQVGNATTGVGSVDLYDNAHDFGITVTAPSSLSANATVTLPTATGTVATSLAGSGVVHSTTPTVPDATGKLLLPALVTQSANTVWAGPCSGSPATPTFRSPCVADMPSGVAQRVAGDGVVDSSTPAVASGGTSTLTVLNQSANKVFAGPCSGSPAAPTFRSPCAADLPTSLPAGTGSGTFMLGGLLCANVTITSNVPTQNAWTYVSCAVPANTLVADAQTLEILVSSSQSSTAGTKGFQLWWGGTGCSGASSPSAACSGGCEISAIAGTGVSQANVHKFYVVRVGSSNQRAFGSVSEGASANTPIASTCSVDPTSSQNIVFAFNNQTDTNPTATFNLMLVFFWGN